MEQPQFSKHHYGPWVPVGIVLVLAMIVLLVTLLGTRQDATDRVARAQQLFAQRKAAGVSMENGPCLGTLEPDWVVDVAHNPRQSSDDAAENQCSEFREGTAKHFIELDINGSFLRER